jgi:hypothetical protein
LIVFSHDIAQILTRKRSVRTFPCILTCQLHKLKPRLTTPRKTIRAPTGAGGPTSEAHCLHSAFWAHIATPECAPNQRAWARGELDPLRASQRRERRSRTETSSVPLLRPTDQQLPKASVQEPKRAQI